MMAKARIILQPHLYVSISQATSRGWGFGRYRNRDKKVFYIGAVVSVDDRGVWEADLSLLHFAQKLNKAKDVSSVSDYSQASCEHGTDARRKRLCLHEPDFD